MTLETGVLAWKQDFKCGTRFLDFEEDFQIGNGNKIFRLETGLLDFKHNFYIENMILLLERGVLDWEQDC